MTGTENDLNRVLSTFVDSEHEIPNFCHSRYLDTSATQSFSKTAAMNFWYLCWIFKMSMQSLAIYFLSSVISYCTDYILARFVCKTRGLPRIPICPYHNSLVTNSFIKVANVLRMVDWLYTAQMKFQVSYDHYLKIFLAKHCQLVLAY